jgi:DNA polymerase III epsilon subunit family exonuclease
MDHPPFETPLADATFVVFDFETTGLDVTRGARVVEIGALKLERGDVIDHFLTLVDPGVPIPADATAVHGLTDADVAGQAKLAETFPGFITFAGDAALVAYNLPFDLSFAVAATKELGLGPLKNATVDLLALARHYYPSLESHKLESLARALNVANPAPHRAMGDVAVESQLLLTFLAQGRERGETETVRDLVLLSRGIPATPDIRAEAIVKLEWAAAAQEAVAIIYRGSKGESSRSITPYGIRTRGGLSYVAAYCHASGAKREFRLERLRLAPGDG